MTNAVSVVVVFTYGPTKYVLDPFNAIAFEDELYTGDPPIVLVEFTFPLLSLHWVTFEPDSVMVAGSAASNHN